MTVCETYLPAAIPSVLVNLTAATFGSSPLAHATFQLFCRFLYFKVDHLPLNGQSWGQETGVKIVWNNPSPPLRSRFSCERVERDSRGARYRIVANDTAKTFEIIYFKVA